MTLEPAIEQQEGRPTPWFRAGRTTDLRYNQSVRRLARSVPFYVLN